MGGAHIAPGGGGRKGNTPDPPPSMTDLLLGGSDPPPSMTDLALGAGWGGEVRAKIFYAPSALLNTSTE